MVIPGLGHLDDAVVASVTRRECPVMACNCDAGLHMCVGAATIIIIQIRSMLMKRSLHWQQETAIMCQAMVTQLCMQLTPAHFEYQKRIADQVADPLKRQGISSKHLAHTVFAGP